MREAIKFHAITQIAQIIIEINRNHQNLWHRINRNINVEFNCHYLQVVDKINTIVRWALAQLIKYFG
jgi:hypothetical protein